MRTHNDRNNVFESVIKFVFPNLIFSGYMVRIKFMENFYNVDIGNEHITTVMKKYIEHNKIKEPSLEHPKFVGAEEAKLGDTNICAIVFNFEDNEGIVKFITVFADMYNMHCMYVVKENGVMKLYETFPNQDRIKYWGKTNEEDYLKLAIQKSLLISIEAENLFRFTVEQAELPELIKNNPKEYEKADKPKLLLELCDKVAKDRHVRHPYDEDDFGFMTTEHNLHKWDFILMPILVGTNWAEIIVVTKSLTTGKYKYFLVEKSFMGYVITNGQSDPSLYKIYASIDDIDINRIVAIIDNILEAIEDEEEKEKEKKINKGKIIEFTIPNNDSFNEDEDEDEDK